MLVGACVDNWKYKSEEAMFHYLGLLCTLCAVKGRASVLSCKRGCLVDGRILTFKKIYLLFLIVIVELTAELQVLSTMYIRPYYSLLQGHPTDYTAQH